MMRLIRGLAVAAAVALSSSAAYPAGLSVGSISVLPGTTGNVVVSGDVAGELTFGVTILVELVPRAGATGTVSFTPALPVDISQSGDPWPGVGTFDTFDTDLTGSVQLNGSVDDDGVFQPAPVTYTGPLTTFPITASTNADGIWDVLLSTTSGDSSWEGLTTTLIAGTVTAMAGECAIDADCDDLIACTDDTCVTATCVFTANNANCTDDGLFCNGPEICDSASGCISSGDPCLPAEFCNETTDTCDECQLDGDCNDGVACTDDSCSGGSCVFAPNNANCPDDGLFCTGSESCDAVNDCVSSGNPCQQDQVCDEPADSCRSCLNAAECDDGDACTDDACNAGVCTYTNNTAPCDDGLFCTLTDVCGGGVCTGSGDPCPGLACDEALDVCFGAAASLTVQSMTMSNGSIADLVVSGDIAGFDTFGVSIQVELLPRVGNFGTLTFTSAPPDDIQQLGDPWPGTGSFSSFDTNITGSGTLNGSVDDNGTFIPGPLSFSGTLSSFPVTSSGDAAGTWDVLLSTSSGDSTWEGVATTLVAGTIDVPPSVSLTAESRAMPPDATTNLVVSGTIGGESTFGVNILLELVPRAGATGTVVFTPSPPEDIQQVGDPWSGVGAFSSFDTDLTGSSTLNGSVDDNGTLVPAAVTFDGLLSSFPVVASVGADGEWDITLSTSAGDSNWEGLTTALFDGVLTVTPSACLIDANCDDGNLCTNDTCAAGTCQNVNNSVVCDDSDPCTSGDVCTGGACAGTVIPDGSACEDGDACTANDVCNSGLCAGTQIPDGGSCDDGNLCTQSDICTLGVCGGTPTDCSAQDGPCTVGVCSALTGLCSANPINEGNACDDGDLCTTGDTCTAGVCESTPVDCSSLDGPCSAGTCNATTGLCEGLPINEGGACDDNDPCTVSDVCTNSVCAGGPPDCTPFDTSCAVGTCNPLNGLCESISVSDGTACDDDDQCTSGDVCTGGTCAGGPTDCTALDDACNAGTCNPSSGACLQIPANDGATCDDGLVCTTGDVCSNGVCEGTLTSAPIVDLSMVLSAPTVSVGGTLFVDLFAASGTCADQPFASAEVIFIWDPGLIELTGFTNPGPHSSTFPDDSNLDGLNAPFTDLPDNDGDAMYLGFAGFAGDVTVPPSGMLLTRLQFTALDGTTGTPLLIPPTAGLFTQTRVLGAGSTAGQDITGALDSVNIVITECQSNIDCDDGNVCTTDTCDANQLCVYTTNTASCDDGIFCTATDVCASAVCVGSGDPCPGQMCSEALDACVECLLSSDCDDLNLCTNNLCDALGACTYPNNTLPCDDGLFCTQTDVCSGGACVGTGASCTAPQLCDEPGDRCVQCLVDGDCTDGNLCTTDTCNTIPGQCLFTNNVLPCDDGAFCTTGDTCTNGSCVGSGDPCPGQLCNESTDACVECIINADCSTDNNECTDERCIAGACFNINHTRPCDDGQFCTPSDVCLNGACQGSGDSCPGELCDETGDRCVECLADAACNDGIACTADSCDLVSGACVHAPDPVQCDDGVFCNGAEVCSLTVGCQSPGNPCDNPDLCDEVNDACGCEPPTVIAEGGRSIQVVPAPGVTPVLIRVMGSPSDSRVACVDGNVLPSGQVGSSLVFRTPDEWGTVHIGDSEIIPGASYVIQSDCRPTTGDPVNLSTPVAVTTWAWGDVTGEGQTNFTDISLVVDGFRNVFVQATLYNVDLHDCVPNRQVNFSDVSWAIDAFRQQPFPCGNPCP